VFQPRRRPGACSGAPPKKTDGARRKRQELCSSVMRSTCRSTDTTTVLASYTTSTPCHQPPRAGQPRRRPSWLHTPPARRATSHHVPVNRDDDCPGFIHHQHAVPPATTCRSTDTTTVLASYTTSTPCHLRHPTLAYFTVRHTHPLTQILTESQQSTVIS